MPPTKHQAFALYAKLKPHHYAVSQAKKAVSAWLAKVQNPYLAFSGGKDSLCVLHLVREQRPDVPAVYFDANNAFPEVEELLAQTPNLIRFQADEPFLETLARYGFGADEAKALDRATMKSTVWNPVNRLIARYQFDGMAYGLRKQESHRRKVHGLTRGAVFQYKRDGLWGCQPVTDWKYMDVWAYIVSQNLSYCATYDKMWDMPEAEQRISYWAGETNRERGRWAWLKRNYPDLFNQFRQRFPEASCYV